jgi:hypothetical protein
MKAHSEVFKSYENIGLYLLKRMQDVRWPDGSAMPVLHSIHKIHTHHMNTASQPTQTQ